MCHEQHPYQNLGLGQATKTDSSCCPPSSHSLQVAAIFLAVHQEAFHHMFMIAVLKYSSLCQLTTHDLVMIKTLNFCRFCLFCYLFGFLRREVLPIMSAEIDDILKRWVRLRVCNLCEQKLSKQQGNEGTQDKRSFVLSWTEVLVTKNTSMECLE